MTIPEGRSLPDVAGDPVLEGIQAVIDTLGGSTAEAPAQTCPYAHHVGATSVRPEVTIGQGNLDVSKHSRRELQGALWRRFREEHHELRTVSEIFTDGLVRRLGRTDPEDVAVETEALKPAYNLPSKSDDLVYLPPHIFGNLDDPNWEPRVPETPAEFEALKKKYEENRSNGWMDNPINGNSNFSSSPESFLKVLEWMREHNMTDLDKESWETYRQAEIRQYESGCNQVDVLASYRFQSADSMVGFDYMRQLFEDAGVARTQYSIGVFDAPRRHEAMDGGTTPADYFVLPVGEYGEQWAEKLLRLGVFTKREATAAAQNFDVRDAANEHKTVIREHTARGRISPPEVPVDEKLGHMGEESTTSVMQTLSLLTAHKVPGFDNPEDLARAVIDAGLVEEFTRETPAGLVAPFAFSGRTFPNLVERTENGGVQLNPMVMEHIKRAKDAQVKVMAEGWDQHYASGGETKRADMLGLICPAAMPHGAVGKLARAMGRLI
jgi:hypothetical protein